jgi:hypothetical protein
MDSKRKEGERDSEGEDREIEGGEREKKGREQGRGEER